MPTNDYTLLEILQQAVEAGASDVHLHSGESLRLRVHGELQKYGDGKLTEATVRDLLSQLVAAESLSRLDSTGQIDFSATVPGLARFRGSAYRQRRGMDLVLRIVPAEAPSLENLGLPKSLAALTRHHQGLVLISGPSGCGKTSTLAALVDLINRERPEHVITLEDPVEIVHRSRQCFVHQRQIGRHSESFANALRAALREDPDVIVVGELRDLETISLALTAAETGHLVFGTLHTGGAVQTIHRLVGVFPADEQDHIRVMLSESLLAIVSQRLARRADGCGRVAALEILMANQAIGNMIRTDKTFQIESVLQRGASDGMILMEESLRSLVRDGTIEPSEAARHSRTSGISGG